MSVAATLGTLCLYWSLVMRLKDTQVMWSRHFVLAAEEFLMNYFLMRLEGFQQTEPDIPAPWHGFKALSLSRILFCHLGNGEHCCGNVCILDSSPKWVVWFPFYSSSLCFLVPEWSHPGKPWTRMFGQAHALTILAPSAAMWTISHQSILTHCLIDLNSYPAPSVEVVTRAL